MSEMNPNPVFRQKSFLFDAEQELSGEDDELSPKNLETQQFASFRVVRRNRVEDTRAAEESPPPPLIVSPPEGETHPSTGSCSVSSVDHTVLWEPEAIHTSSIEQDALDVESMLSLSRTSDVGELSSLFRRMLTRKCFEMDHIQRRAKTITMMHRAVIQQKDEEIARRGERIDSLEVFALSQKDETALSYMANGAVSMMQPLLDLQRQIKAIRAKLSMVRCTVKQQVDGFKVNLKAAQRQLEHCHVLLAPQQHDAMIVLKTCDKCSQPFMSEKARTLLQEVAQNVDVTKVNMKSAQRQVEHGHSLFASSDSGLVPESISAAVGRNDKCSKPFMSEKVRAQKGAQSRNLTVDVGLEAILETVLDALKAPKKSVINPPASTATQTDFDESMLIDQCRVKEMTQPFMSEKAQTLLQEVAQTVERTVTAAAGWNDKCSKPFMSEKIRAQKGAQSGNLTVDVGLEAILETVLDALKAPKKSVIKPADPPASTATQTDFDESMLIAQRRVKELKQQINELLVKNTALKRPPLATTLLENVISIQSLLTESKACLTEAQTMTLKKAESLAKEVQAESVKVIFKNVVERIKEVRILQQQMQEPSVPVHRVLKGHVYCHKCSKGPFSVNETFRCDNCFTRLVRPLTSPSHVPKSRPMSTAPSDKNSAFFQQMEARRIRREEELTQARQRIAAKREQVYRHLESVLKSVSPLIAVGVPHTLPSASGLNPPGNLEAQYYREGNTVMTYRREDGKVAVESSQDPHQENAVKSVVKRKLAPLLLDPTVVPLRSTLSVPPAVLSCITERRCVERLGPLTVSRGNLKSRKQTSILKS